MTARILSTAHGTNRHAFTGLDWGLFTALSLIWGSSFLFIAVGLDAVRPGVVTFVRIGLGALTLVLLDRSEVKLDRHDWPRVVVLSLLWMAIPYTLFPIAQQWVDSAVAGMLNGTTPLLTALVAAALLRQAPRRAQVVGLIVGFAGVVLITLPEAGEGTTQVLGVALIILATACYALSLNLITPLQQRYGSRPVMRRIAALAVLWSLPLGIAHLPGSDWTWQSTGAMLALGVLGTGLALSWAALLIGRVGGTRASIVTYLIPVVALILGVALRGEQIHPLALVGTVMVVAGAFFTSRREV